MLLLFGTFLAFVVGLSLVKAEIVRIIMHASHRVSGGPHLGIWLYALLFFPGTVIHELSHFFAAEVLRVKTGEIHLLPKEDSGQVRLGYVTVAKADVFRSFLIGTAPFVIGLTVVCGLVWFQFHALPISDYSLQNTRSILLTLIHKPVVWLVFYFMLVLSHAMFLSEADRGEIYLIPITLVIVGSIVYFFHAHIRVPSPLIQHTATILTLLDISLGIMLVFNVVFLITLAVLKKLLDSIF